MPRFVRPAWIEVYTDTSPSRGMGPRTRDGYLSASLTLRDTYGSVSDAIRLQAGGHFADGTGRAHIDIPRTLAVEITDAVGTVTVYPAGGIRALDVRPVAD